MAQQDILTLQQPKAAFLSMMAFIESLMNDQTPFLRRYGGYIYFLPNKDQQDRWDQLIDNRPEEAFSLATFILKEGTDKYIEMVLTSGYQNVSLLGSTGNEISFTFVTKDGNSNLYEPVTVTYRIECEGRVQVIQEQYAPRDTVHFNLDTYLTEGKNTISITVRGNNSKVSTTETVVYNYVDLAVSTDFNIANVYGVGDTISFNATVKGTSDGNAGVTVECYVDYGMSTAISVQTTVNESLDGTNVKRVNIDSSILPFNPGKHTLQVRSRAKIGGVDRYSRVWYYEYIVAGATAQFITIKRLLDDTNPVSGIGNVVLQCEKYVKETIVYGYYSYMQGQSANVKWELSPVSGGDSTSVGSSDLGGDIAGTEGKEHEISFMPVESGSYRLNALVNGVHVQGYDVAIENNHSGLEEASVSDLVVRLFALGRRNDEPVEDRTVWKYKDVVCRFEGFGFDGVSGWVNNALQVIGSDCRLVIPAKPLANMYSDSEGFCVELDYETFSCADTTAVVARCGSNIEVLGDSARLSTNISTVSISTRYPVGNRQKMAFNVHSKRSSTQPRIMELITDGVSSACSGYAETDSFLSTEDIVIGGTDKCGIRIYSVRAYAISLTNKQELNNNIIDAADIAAAVRDNSIYDGANVNVEELKNRIACLKLTGRGGINNLNTIWNSQSKQLVYMDAEWTNPAAPDTNWRCTDMRTRSHGQSTLRNPLKSLKIWLKNESGQAIHNTQFFFPSTAEQPMSDPRWAMKPDAMPQNKFVMQCYYIDSSNCKSPVLMQIIDSAMRGAGIYTPPMRYAYGRSGKCWYNDMKERYPDDPKCWEFPLNIRYTPDSIPCILTTQDTPNDPEKLVGIFVLMDDKKSDYLYGERSIYACPGDPYCFDHDKDAYECLWDNSDTTRFEILSNTHPIVTFKNVSTFYLPPQEFVPDDDEQDVTTDIEGGDGATGDTDAGYDFEQAIELVYPDIDDLKEKKKWPLNYIPDNTFNPAQASNIDTCHSGRVWQFFRWVCDCYQAWRDGDDYLKFRAEAADHMDLEQWAAYYDFMLPNGAFDNLVRNMQLTTFERNDKGFYVWLPMDWDNDILYGTINTGPYAYDPPVTRQTRNDRYGVAFRGMECWLWDALEAWPDFLTLCRSTMNRLNANGYNYANVIARQIEFTSAWPKALYNESQNVKYKQMFLASPASNARYLSYLLGDGETLRKWWMKKNYDFWMAKLAAGDFTKNGVSVRWDGEAGDRNPTLRVTYAEDSFFGWMVGDTLQFIAGYGFSQEVTAGQEVSFTTTDISNSIYTTVFSAPYIRKADFSELAFRLGVANLQYFADPVVGTNLQELLVGVRDDDLLHGLVNSRSNVLIGLGDLTELRTLQIQGYTAGEALDLSSLTLLTHLHAKGSAYNNVRFSTSAHLTRAELPTTISAIAWDYVRFDRLSFHGVGINCDNITDYPESLLTASLIGMGGDANIRRMVMSWLRAKRGTNGLRLTLTGINWDNMDYDDVLLMAEAFGSKSDRIYAGKVRITTVHGEERTLSTPEMNTLVDLYNDADRGVNVFSPQSSFQIDCTAGFVLTGPQTILAGRNGQIVGAVFPITAGGYSFHYTIHQIDGAAPSSAIGTVNGWQTYRNVRLNTNTGLIETTETNDPTVHLTIHCTASSVSNPTQSGFFETTVQKRTYPQSLVISGTKDISFNGEYLFNIEYTPAVDDNYGTMTRFEWLFENVDGISLVNQRAGSALLRVNDFAEDMELVIGYRETYRDGNTYTAAPVTISLVYNALEGILFADTNYPVFSAFLQFIVESDGKYHIESPVVMSRIEARQFNALPPSLSENDEVTHFEEIRYFKNLDSIDMHGCHRLDGEINITELNRCESVNLEATYASISF